MLTFMILFVKLPLIQLLCLVSSGLGQLHTLAQQQHACLRGVLLLLFLVVCCCSWLATLVKEGLAERYIPIDFAEVDTVFDRCLAVSLNSKTVEGSLKDSDCRRGRKS